MGRTERRAEERRRQRLRRYYMVGGAVAAVAVVVAAAMALAPPPHTGPSTAGRTCGSIQVPQGEIKVVFYTDLTPTTAGRFSSLFQGGYYNALPWTRGPPEEDWVLQAGQGGSQRDPIPLEINKDVKNVRGSLGAARSDDPNSATTQFYILKKDSPHLDAGYSVFASVLSGMNIVDLIQKDSLITRTSVIPCPS